MPRFIVHAHRYVEEIARIEVDAGTPEAARQNAAAALIGHWQGNARLAWAPGDDITDPEIYEVCEAEPA